MRNCKSLFQQIFIVYKTFTVGKNLKTYQERLDLVCGRYIKVFYKTTNCSIRPLLIGPKSSHLVQV